MTADFEKPRVALAVIQIPFERRGHGYDAGGAQHVRFFRKRIRKTSRRNTFWTEQRVTLFRDVGNRQNLTVTETDEPFAQTRFGFVVREARRALACGRQAGRKFIEAVNARDFFDQINFAFDLGAPRGLGALPRREERAFRAAVLIDSNGGETERTKTRFHFLVGNVRT